MLPRDGYFVEELCQSLPEWAGDDPSAARAEVPATLHGLIEARVGRLPEDRAEVARAAAVIGLSIPAWLLEVIVPLSFALIGFRYFVLSVGWAKLYLQHRTDDEPRET